MKLTLDHKALELLFNSDKEFKLALTNGVINTFANKHLKVVVNSDAYKEHLAALRKEYIKLVTEQFGEVQFLYCGNIISHIKLSEEVHNTLLNYAQNYAKRILDEQFREIENKVNEIVAKVDLDSIVQQKVDMLTNIKVNELVSKRFTEINEAIKTVMEKPVTE